MQNGTLRCSVLRCLQRLIAIALSARSLCEVDLAAVLVHKGAELAHQVHAHTRARVRRISAHKHAHARTRVHIHPAAHAFFRPTDPFSGSCTMPFRSARLPR
jgi:hypothetical protein